MDGSGATHYRWQDMPKEPLNPELSRRLISGERLMVAQVYLEKGCVVPRHSHENEQLTWIVEGVMRFWLGDDESTVVDVAAGEVLHIPSNLPHKAEAWRRRSTSTSSRRRGRTGSTSPTPTFGAPRVLHRAEPQPVQVIRLGLALRD